MDKSAYFEQFTGDVAQQDICDNCGHTLCDAFTVYDDEGEETNDVSCSVCGWIAPRPDDCPDAYVDMPSMTFYPWGRY